MDPKFLARAKARSGTVKGPPPLPTMESSGQNIADRPTPRPPALDPDRPTPRPPAPALPALALPDTVAEPAPPTPRPVPVEAPDADDEEEHTVMRPPTVPLPADAFRDDAVAPSPASDAEHGVGLPLELAVEKPAAGRSRAGIAWAVLAALGLAAGTLVFVKHREASSALANAAAQPAEPKSFTRPPRPPPPKRRAQGKLDPPISTSFKDNESLPEEEVAATPTVRRRPRPRPAPPPHEAAASEQAVSGSAPAVATGSAGSSGIAPQGGPSPSPQQPGNTQPGNAQPGNAQPGTAPAAGTPTASTPAAAPTTGATAPTPPVAPTPPAARLPAESKPATDGEEQPQGSVDTDNPYGD